MIDKYEFGATIAKAIRDYGLNSGRSQQSNEGRLGPSDIGWCREKARLMTIGVKPTDEVSIFAAQVGTAVHSYMEKVVRDKFPTWLIEQTVTATLSNGAEIQGTADAIAVDYNAVVDWKTVNGLTGVKRYGTSQNHKYQRFLYALGAIQAGLLDENQPVWVVNVYLDRSGTEPVPHVEAEELDMTLQPEIESWVDDVIYAVQHQQQASKDVAPAVCAKVCDRFTACRGGVLPVEEGGDWIEDEPTVNAISLWLEAKEMEREAKKMREEASAQLTGISGRTKTHQVRWVTVNPTEIPGFTRAGYERLDVVKVKEPK